MRALPWLVAASLAAVGAVMPTAAHACTCGPVVITAGPSDPPPANGLVLLTSCSDHLPVEQLDVRVDGHAAELADAGIEVGPYSALLRIEPPPMEGQTVTVSVLEDQRYPLVFGPTEWMVGPVDDAPPMASATTVVQAGDKEGDGISCPPFGPHFIVVLSDMVFDDDVAFVRAEVVRERVVTAVDVLAWDASAWPPGAPLALHVFAETDGEACIQAFAMDLAGNETRLGTNVCEVDPVTVEDVEDQEALEERGCSGCSSTGASRWGQSFSLIGDPTLRKQYDDLRIELDAFLRARAGGGEAKVEKPEGFVESPEVRDADLHAFAYALCRGSGGDTEGA